MRRTLLLPLVLLALLAGAPAQAQVVARPVFGTALGLEQQLRERQALRPLAGDTAAVASPDAGIRRLELDGLVVDETLTRLGRDFYDAFFRAWQAPPEALNYTVTIQEQPLPQLGTLVTVRVNDEIAYQNRLQPQADFIEAVALQAVAFTARLLQTRGGRPLP